MYIPTSASGRPDPDSNYAIDIAIISTIRALTAPVLKPPHLRRPRNNPSFRKTIFINRPNERDQKAVCARDSVTRPGRRSARGPKTGQRRPGDRENWRAELPKRKYRNLSLSGPSTAPEHDSAISPPTRRNPPQHPGGKERARAAGGQCRLQKLAMVRCVLSAAHRN